MGSDIVGLWRVLCSASRQHQLFQSLMEIAEEAPWDAQALGHRQHVLVASTQDPQILRSSDPQILTSLASTERRELYDAEV